jgi:hypothetical protein
MSTRKRKQDEELVALPSDESEEEEEYVLPAPFHHQTIAAHQHGLNWHLYSFTSCYCASMRVVVDAAAVFAPGKAAFQPRWQ